MFCSCCQLSGWLPFTHKVLSSKHLTLRVLRANNLSIRFLEEHPKRRRFRPPVWSVLCTVSPFVFLQLKVNSPSALCSFFFFINPQRLNWAHKLCFCITLLCIYTVIHAAPLGASKYNRLLSSSTGADGIKGKGCSLTCALFRFFIYIRLKFGEAANGAMPRSRRRSKVTLTPPAWHWLFFLIVINETFFSFPN